MNLEALIEIISNVTKFEVEEITKESTLGDELAIDSLEMLKITTELEVKLGVILDADKIAKLITVEDLYNYILSR